jgi:hypothetical protein
VTFFAGPKKVTKERTCAALGMLSPSPELFSPFYHKKRIRLRRTVISQPLWANAPAYPLQKKASWLGNSKFKIQNSLRF